VECGPSTARLRVHKSSGVQSALGVKACNDDKCRDGQQLIQSKGYPFEEHFAKTSDCFTLRMFRIPGPQGSSGSSSGKPVVLLQHGVLDTSDTWMMNHAQNSLSFMLADAGFDVWLGNTRGNRYSRNSTCYNPDSWINHKFWEWSYDEMAKFDMPAQVDKALEISGAKSLTYIGHSQGTTQAFSNFMQSSEYNLHLQGKINAFIALAPVFHLKNTKSLALSAMSNLDIDVLVKLIGIHEFLPSSKLLKLILPKLCTAEPKLCENSIGMFAGFDAADFDETRIGVYVAHFPNGVSIQEICHFAQSVRKNPVSYYDYGFLGNLLHYKSRSAPVYDLTKSQAPPTYFFYGGLDDLANSKDVEQLLNEFPKSAQAQVNFNPAYGHLDYVWGKNSYLDVYQPIVKIIQNLSANAVQAQTDSALSADQEIIEQTNTGIPSENLENSFTNENSSPLSQSAVSIHVSVVV